MLIEAFSACLFIYFFKHVTPATLDFTIKSPIASRPPSDYCLCQLTFRLTSPFRIPCLHCGPCPPTAMQLFTAWQGAWLVLDHVSVQRHPLASAAGLHLLHNHLVVLRNYWTVCPTALNRLVDKIPYSCFSLIKGTTETINSIRDKCLLPLEWVCHD